MERELEKKYNVIEIESVRMRKCVVGVHTEITENDSLRILPLQVYLYAKIL